MSDMKKLLESVTKFSFANPKQKPGDQVRGTDRAKKNTNGKHPFAGRLVGGANESIDAELSALADSLLEEYHVFEATPTPTVANSAVSMSGAPSTVAAQQAKAASQTASGIAPQPQQGGIQPPTIPGQPGVAGQPANGTTPAANQAQPAKLSAQDLSKITQQQQKTKQDINSHLSQIKTTVDPALNVPKVTGAFDKLNKNPGAQLTPDEAKNMAQLTAQMEPVLTNNTGTSNLKTLIKKMTDLQTQQQAQQAKQ